MQFYDGVNNLVIVSIMDFAGIFLLLSSFQHDFYYCCVQEVKELFSVCHYKRAHELNLFLIFHSINFLLKSLPKSITISLCEQKAPSHSIPSKCVLKKKI